MRSSNIGNKNPSNKFLIPFTGLLLLVTAGTIHHSHKKPELFISKQDSAININTDLLVYLSAGNKRLISDLLWIQTLLESDLSHYTKKDFNNWMYLRFSTIQSLDPKFYDNYKYGGQFLAIIKDDLEGANNLYAKAMEQYPEDYTLNFNAGFLNYFERNDFKLAKKYLSKVISNPNAPEYLRSILNKLEYSISKDLASTFELVLVNYNEQTDGSLKKRLYRDLYSIRAEIDLECLNTTGKDCRSSDLDGRPYIKKNLHYETETPFIKYSIRTRGDKVSPLSNKN